MATPSRRRRNILIVALTVVVAGISGSLLVLHRMIAKANRDYCGGNLHAIGLAIILYQQDHQGAYPDTLATLMRDEKLSPGTFVCPAVNDSISQASGSTTQAMLAEFSAGGHCSYRYTGAGLTDKTVTDDTVITFEPIESHGNGCNVLFGDGRFEFVDKPTALRIAADADVTRFPIRAKHRPD